MDQIHCHKCRSNKVNVNSQPVLVLKGFLCTLAGAVLLYIALTSDIAFVIAAVPFFLFATYAIYRFFQPYKIVCYCRNCNRRFVINTRFEAVTQPHLKQANGTIMLSRAIIASQTMRMGKQQYSR